MKEWPFESPPNEATITVRQILEGEKPILLVTRAADDGTWCFLTGDEFYMDDGRIVALREHVQRDPTVAELADLPPGWFAERPTVDAPWERAPDPDQ